MCSNESSFENHQLSLIILFNFFFLISSKSSKLSFNEYFIIFNLGISTLDFGFLEFQVNSCLLTLLHKKNRIISLLKEMKK